MVQGPPLLLPPQPELILFFFFNDTATTEIYTLSLHDALPIFPVRVTSCFPGSSLGPARHYAEAYQDRKSTRLNSSHSQISYAVFCLKKKTMHREVRAGTSSHGVRRRSYLKARLT